MKHESQPAAFPVRTTPPIWERMHVAAPPGVPNPYPLTVPNQGGNTPFSVAKSQKTARLPARDIPFHSGPSSTAHSTGPERKVPPYAYSLATHCKLDPSSPYPYGPYVAAFPYGPYGYGGYAYNHQAYPYPQPEGLAMGGMVPGGFVARGAVASGMAAATQNGLELGMDVATGALLYKQADANDDSTGQLDSLQATKSTFQYPSPAKSAPTGPKEDRWKEAWAEYEGVCSKAHTSPYVGPYLGPEAKQSRYQGSGY